MGNCVRSSRDDDGVLNVFGGPREVNLTAKDGRVHRCIKIGKRLFITLTKEKQVALIAIPEGELRLLRNVEKLSVMEPGTQRLFGRVWSVGPSAWLRPQLQCACLMSMGRLPARLPGCILVPSAWLQGNAPPYVFLGHGRARLLLGDFRAMGGGGGWLT